MIPFYFTVKDLGLEDTMWSLVLPTAINTFNMIILRSVHNFNTNVASTDYILTLSTCYKTDERVVVHAKLIKKEAR